MLAGQMIRFLRFDPGWAIIMAGALLLIDGDGKLSSRVGRSASVHSPLFVDQPRR
jgi:hypothetical protein